MIDYAPKIFQLKLIHKLCTSTGKGLEKLSLNQRVGHIILALKAWFHLYMFFLVVMLFQIWTVLQIILELKKVGDMEISRKTEHFRYPFEFVLLSVRFFLLIFFFNAVYKIVYYLSSIRFDLILFFRMTTFTDFVRLVGKPYMWVQRICGLNFLTKELHVRGCYNFYLFFYVSQYFET